MIKRFSFNKNSKIPILGNAVNHQWNCSFIYIYIRSIKNRHSWCPIAQIKNYILLAKELACTKNESFTSKNYVNNSSPLLQAKIIINFACLYQM